jgi:hypothetical protein
VDGIAASVDFEKILNRYRDGLNSHQDFGGPPSFCLNCRYPCSKPSPGKDVEIRVWDSTAAVRYLVLPERPTGSETLSEEALTALVTRDALIGIAKVKLPQAGTN